MNPVIEGHFDIQVDKGMQSIPYLLSITKSIGGFEVKFAVHVHPQDKRTLVISEMSTGCDTTMRIRHPKSPHMLLELCHVANGSVPRGQLRKLTSSAVHNGLKRIGHLQFLVAIQGNKDKATENADT